MCARNIRTVRTPPSRFTTSRLLRVTLPRYGFIVPTAGDGKSSASDKRHVRESARSSARLCLELACAPTVFLSGQRPLRELSAHDLHCDHATSSARRRPRNRRGLLAPLGTSRRARASGPARRDRRSLDADGGAHRRQVPRQGRIRRGSDPGRRSGPGEVRGPVRPRAGQRLRELCGPDHRRRDQAPLPRPHVGRARATPGPGGAQQGPRGREGPDGELGPTARRRRDSRVRAAERGRRTRGPGSPGQFRDPVTGRPAHRRRPRILPGGRAGGTRHRVRPRRGPRGPETRPGQAARARADDPVPAVLPRHDADLYRRAAGRLADARLAPAQQLLRLPARGGARGRVRGR